MKYYSRSPEELKERFEEAKQKEKNRNRTIRLFFILHILLVVLVLGILQYRIRFEEEQNKPKTKEFLLGPYSMRSICNLKNCRVEIYPNQEKSFLLEKPNFLVFSRISFLKEKTEEKKTLVALSPEILGEYFFNPTEPLKPNEKIKLYLLSKDQKELLALDIYP